MLPKMHHDTNTRGRRGMESQAAVIHTPCLTCSCYYLYLSLTCRSRFWQWWLFLIIYKKINRNMCLIQTIYHLGSHVKWLIMFKTNRNRLGDRMCCNKTISFLNLDLKFNLKVRKMASRNVLALLLKSSFFSYVRNYFGLLNASL